MSILKKFFSFFNNDGNTEELVMGKINKLLVGEALCGGGEEKTGSGGPQPMPQPPSHRC